MSGDSGSSGETSAYELQMAFDQERELTACELHDRIVGDVQAALAHVEELIHAGAVSDSNYLDRIAVLLRSAITESRALLARLSTSMSELSEPSSADLVSVLQGIRDQPRSDNAPRVEFHHDTDANELSGFARRMLIGIATEAVNNARKYSQSTRIRIRLRRKGAGVQLDIRDWGIGFDMAQVGADSFGLRSIRARASLAGGRASISSARHQGTEIAVCLPV